MEDFTIEVDNQKYDVKPIEEVDQILYEIQKNNQFVTVIGINENAEWESTTEFDQKEVRKFGNAIDSYEA